MQPPSPFIIFIMGRGECQRVCITFLRHGAAFSLCTLLLVSLVTCNRAVKPPLTSVLRLWVVVAVG